jgi:hypothetical protein
MYLPSPYMPLCHDRNDLSFMFAKVKVKFSLEQTMKAQRGSRGIALLFL